MSEIAGRREARRLLDARLNPVNQGQYRPEATILFSKFVTDCFEPGVLPTLKFATQEIYSLLLRKHLIPRFGDHRLCDISRVEIQQYLLEKLKQGFAWETTNHLRHLLSKVMGTAVIGITSEQSCARCKNAREDAESPASDFSRQMKSKRLSQRARSQPAQSFC